MTLERFEMRLSPPVALKLNAIARDLRCSRSAAVRRLILDAKVKPERSARLTLALAPVPRLPNQALELHERLYGTPPTEQQLKLYTAYGRGYVTDDAPSIEQMDAVITTLIAIAPLRPFGPVALIAPATLRDAIEGRLRVASGAVRQRGLDESVAATIARILLVTLASSDAPEPGVWGAIGVDPAVAPAWLTRRLVEAA